jgi:hypothetical protein
MKEDKRSRSALSTQPGGPVHPLVQALRTNPLRERHEQLLADLVELLRESPMRGWSPMRQKLKRIVNDAGVTVWPEDRPEEDLDQ